jgi:hypothetical protein
MHQQLLQVVRRLGNDYEPFGKKAHDGSDCSCGCRYFVKLAGEIGNDWGVCANSESSRAGLLTFEHQGCTAFEPVSVDRNLTDAQLRHLIGEASQILQDRRRERIAPTIQDEARWPLETGEFAYDVRTSYSPRIKGHFPTIFRLEWHDGTWTSFPLEAKVSGNQRPDVRGHFTARNGDVFKIVRENGDYSYQVPLGGELHNLKQGGRISKIGLPGLETLRPFLESVESEVFEKIVEEVESWPVFIRRWQDDSRDRLRRYRSREYLSDEKPVNKAERREVIREEEGSLDQYPNQLAESAALIEWFKAIDRSNPRLRSVACPPAPEKRPQQR